VSQTLSVWFLVLAALIAANLPFVTRGLFVGVALLEPKSFQIRLLELVSYYFLMGGLALLLENHVGQIASQAWEFYATTATLFLTFAFPGFVYCYLLKRRT
jgi:hypothetical protein